MISGQLDRAAAARDGKRTDQVFGLRLDLPRSPELDDDVGVLPSDHELAEAGLVVTSVFSDAESFSLGLGIAVELKASGPTRFAMLRTQLNALWQRLCLVYPSAEAAQPRVYGGLAFFVEPSEPRWQPFGDASFVLPRLEIRARLDEPSKVYGFIAADELDDRSALTQALERQLGLLSRLVMAMRAAVVEQRTEPVPSVASSTTRPDDGRKSKFCTLVESALSAIELEHFAKVVVARSERLRLRDAPDSLDLMMRLRRLQPNTTQFLFRRGQRRFVGATPELLASVNGTTLQTEAVAGTWASTEGSAAEDALLQSDKERREHAWVVKSIRRTLQAHGVSSVEAETLPSIRRLRGILHLVTPMTATIAPGDILDWVERLHPTPALCGYPAAAAAAFIAEREAPRGWYGAPVGWMDAAGDGAFYVAIRSALVEGTEANIFAGAGIVRGSVPELEYQETETKLESMRGSLEPEPCEAAE